MLSKFVKLLIRTFQRESPKLPSYFLMKKSDFLDAFCVYNVESYFVEDYDGIFR